MIELEKVLTSIGCILGTLSIYLTAVAIAVVAITPTASEYEISIYETCPVYFYISYSVALMIGISLLVNPCLKLISPIGNKLGGLL
jgi:hypothetical protein